MTFEELDLSDAVLDALYDMGFETCTPIQERAIPVILEGRDLIAIAQTGTGKTAAYLLPVIDSLGQYQPQPDSVNCLVLVPTRELAIQIDRQLQGFSYYYPLSSLAIYGGTDGPEFARQQRALRLGTDIVIATPGRLLALLAMGNIDLSRVSTLVLDEADRMLDMGFYDDIMRIVSHLPADRQTLLFSATLPPKIQQIARALLNNPAEVKIAVSRPADGIRQLAAHCNDRDKENVLCRILRDKNVDTSKAVIFASSKVTVRTLTVALQREGFKAAQMHSDLDQPARDAVMQQFRASRVPIIVATDILSRGIDVDDITLVVNYDVPRDVEDYVHRIGRTARAGAQGSALTLVSPRDRDHWTRIEHFIGRKIESIIEAQSTYADATHRTHSNESRKNRRHGRNHKPNGRRRSGRQPRSGSE